MNLRAVQIRTLGRSFEIIYKTVELKFNIRIFKAFLISVSIIFCGL